MVEQAVEELNAGDRTQFVPQGAETTAPQSYTGPQLARRPVLGGSLASAAGLIWQAAGYLDAGRTRVQIYTVALCIFGVAAWWLARGPDYAWGRRVEEAPASPAGVGDDGSGSEAATQPRRAP